MKNFAEKFVVMVAKGEITTLASGQQLILSDDFQLNTGTPHDTYALAQEEIDNQNPSDRCVYQIDKVFVPQQ
jgi:hypothetical protein